MTRQEVLDYIIETHGDALTAAGIAHADDPTSLYYVLYDAMLYEDVDEQQQMDVADAKVAQLIADKTAAMKEEAQRQERLANEEALRSERERLAERLPESSLPDERQIRFRNRVTAQAEQPERVLVDPRTVEE
jgi:hypothetical protein